MKLTAKEAISKISLKRLLPDPKIEIMEERNTNYFFAHPQPLV